VSFGQSIRTCLSKYADFTGTASRPEYWWFLLFVTLAGAAATAATPTSLPAGAYGTVFSIAMFLPLFAAGARRLHDTGRSGWYQLFVLIPVVGGLLLLWLLAEKSKVAAGPQE
jgi:uncharacterized membrane protein YhaH (DUF805 family)